MPKRKTIVMKFGGTSVGDAERMQRVASIIADNQKTANIVVVTSAMSQATDLLIGAAQAAAQKNRGQLDECMDRLRKLHQTAIVDLHLSTPAQTTLHRSVQKQLDHSLLGRPHKACDYWYSSGFEQSL